MADPTLSWFDSPDKNAPTPYKGNLCISCFQEEGSVFVDNFHYCKSCYVAVAAQEASPSGGSKPSPDRDVEGDGGRRDLASQFAAEEGRSAAAGQEPQREGQTLSSEEPEDKARKDERASPLFKKLSEYQDQLKRKQEEIDRKQKELERSRERIKEMEESRTVDAVAVGGAKVEGLQEKVMSLEAQCEEAERKRATVEDKYQSLKKFYDQKMAKAAADNVQLIRSISPTASPARTPSSALRHFENRTGSSSEPSSPLAAARSSSAAKEESSSSAAVTQIDKQASWQLVWEGFGSGILFAVAFLALLFVNFLQAPRVLPRIG